MHLMHLKNNDLTFSHIFSCKVKLKIIKSTISIKTKINAIMPILMPHAKININIIQDINIMAAIKCGLNLNASKCFLGPTIKKLLPIEAHVPKT